MMANEIVYYKCGHCEQELEKEVQCLECNWVYEEHKIIRDICPQCGNDDKQQTIYLMHSEEQCAEYNRSKYDRRDKEATY